MKHEFVAFVQQFWVFNYFNNAINAGRKQVLMALKENMKSIYGHEKPF